MMKKSKRILSLLLAALLCLSLMTAALASEETDAEELPSQPAAEEASAEDLSEAPALDGANVIDSGKCSGDSNNVTWTLTDDGVLTFSGTGDMGFVSLGTAWLSYQDSITAVIIEPGVTSIGDGAFEGCTGLTSIDIPDSVTIIDWYAFSGCTGLMSIDIPDSVTSIGTGAFNCCTGLTSIDIPDSVTNIGQGAFNGCTGLTSINIPDSVTDIDTTMAFSECTSLTSINIPASVTFIGGWAFAGCTGLTSINIPAGVTSISTSAFRNCTALTDVYFGGSEEQWESIDIRDENDPLLNAAIHFGASDTPEPTPGGANVIDSGKSGGDNNNVTWTLTDDGVLTFSGTGDMGDISWGAPWLSYQDSITAVVIEPGVTSICYDAFSECTGLASIDIPDSVTSIGEYAFSGCTGLTSVTIPDSVEFIGNGAFSGCTGLTSIDIPDSVTSIGYYAFEGCTGLTSIDIPAGVTDIGKGAFDGCTGLTSVTIPNSVEFIGNGAFSGCTSLTDVYFGGSEEQWESIKIWNENDPLLNAVIHFGASDTPEPTAAATPVLEISGDAKNAQVTGDFTGLYARVALVIDNSGRTGLYVTQAPINDNGAIVVPEFMVPGLTVKGVNVTLVPTLDDIQSPTPNVITTASKML